MKQRVIVIGGGAAGLCCAVALAQSGRAQVTVLEALDRVGKKLALTGNGQCNIANAFASIHNYHGEHPSFAGFVLDTYGYEVIKAFFDSLGVPFVLKENGKAYPRSLQASSVVDALRFAAERVGVTVLTGQRVTGLSVKNGFAVRTQTDTFEADKVVFATGGLAAGEKVGSTGEGLRLLKQQGFAVTKLTPSLVQLKTDSPLNRSLKGIKIVCPAVLSAGDQVIRKTNGEVLFTEYGLSGPPILQLSRAVEREKRPCRVTLDLFSEETEDSLTALFLHRRETLATQTSDTFFTGMLQNRLGSVLLKSAGIPLSNPISALKEDDLRHLTELCKALTFPVSGTTGFVHAQVTAGGLSTQAFSETTMESKTVRGLYAIGEILDVDGDCGGYNLSWAWGSALCAASAITEDKR